jgi:SpoVK/Ycf46/Vps4 family AAA+-type ATPase
VRKGRFDEIFFVDLPSKATRAEILRIHLARRDQDPANFDIESIAANADGFSGSEVEQAIVSGLYAAHAQGETLSTEHILQELTMTRPLSVVMHEQIAQLRQWADGRTVPCD